MMLITLPIFFPLIVKLGYDPIWFGVLVTSVVEIGLDYAAGRDESLHYCIGH